MSTLDEAGKQGEKCAIVKEVELRVNENAMLSISLDSLRITMKVAPTFRLSLTSFEIDFAGTAI